MDEQVFPPKKTQKYLGGIKRITRGTDDGCDVVFLAGTINFTESIVKAVGQGSLRSLALDTAQSDLGPVATEEIRLNGVLAVTVAQFTAHHHGLVQAPAVTANQAPVCKSLPTSSVREVDTSTIKLQGDRRPVVSSSETHPAADSIAAVLSSCRIG